MTSYPVGFRVAQVVAITGAGWLGGMWCSGDGMRTRIDLFTYKLQVILHL